jgi:ribonuclease D
MVIDFAFEFITESARAAEALSPLVWQPLLALDTETYWNADYGRSSVSLIQIAAPEMPVLVLDAVAIDLNVVRPLIESGKIMLAAHNARFDEGMLAGEGLKPAGFVDTLKLARIALRLPSYSLAALVDYLFGIKLDKSFQRSNWQRRPLSESQLKYAALDASVTLMLFQRLEEMLREEGRLDLGMRAAILDGPRPTRRSKRVIIPVSERDLTGEEQRLLLELKKWRLEKSFKRRIPAYRVCADRTLNDLVMERPQRLEDLEQIYGIGPSRIAEIGHELLEILRFPSETATESIYESVELSDFVADSEE